jgi:cell division protein FtsI (penicillin-binding protein 3)
MTPADSRKAERRAGTLGVRRRVLLAVWLLGAAAVLARAGQLQVLQGAEWREAALQQHRRSSEVAASRGTILDRDGVELALTRERVKVSLAPGELVDRDAATKLLQDELDLSSREARRLTDPERRWSVVPGRYAPTVREALAGVQGIYLERELERFYPHGDLARGVLGTVLEGAGQGGIEQRYEETLRGRPGREIAARDHAGKEIPGEVVRVEEPVAGGEVRLTLDLDLQEIAHEALKDALETTGARGGDLLVTDPRTGEVLALVSMGDGKSNALSAINAPYEPGSTLKPFTVAGLLAHDLAALDDSVETEGGSWTIEGRTITDVHPYPNMTLGHALSVSSNVGIARAAQAFDPGTQYETLRDFGFGLPTGIELPGEVGGTLRRPDRWSKQSAVSLAIGYEIGVTPLQMALAYGALANGGLLMEPRMVAEVRDGEGRVTEQRAPREVRRVIPADVARDLAIVLEEVVEDGTATAARIENFRVAGKTGTARAHVNGSYSAGRYYSSFVGFFPADAPQLVVFVKLDSPKGAYYGGATAAPVTRAMMEGALAARQTPLDRTALLRSLRRTPSAVGALAAAARRELPATPERREEPAPLRFANLGDDREPLAAVEPMRPTADVLPAGGVTMPDLTGLAPRAAVRRLHALGFRVRWQGYGAVVTTLPAAGARLEQGDTVALRGAVSLQ